MNVRDFLRVRTPFVWGGVDGEDCTTWCARYAELLTGDDPASDLRGTYQNREGALAMIARNGGLVATVAPRLKRSGWRVVQAPADGHMAVIEALANIDGDGPQLSEISALRFGPLWVALGPCGPAGIAASRVRVLACWGLA
ncbi:DUF6950 family protein [Rhizobium sp. SGZ-381]|uniref:DUF6950 family protein n=1 Tax=Rhizobium sp. SGZ-381 TaxID=3342800 RepID=UPI00366FB257